MLMSRSRAAPTKLARILSLSLCDSLAESSQSLGSFTVDLRKIRFRFVYRSTAECLKEDHERIFVY